MKIYFVMCSIKTGHYIFSFCIFLYIFSSVLMYWPLFYYPGFFKKVFNFFSKWGFTVSFRNIQKPVSCLAGLEKSRIRCWSFAQLRGSKTPEASLISRESTFCLVNHSGKKKKTNRSTKFQSKRQNNENLQRILNTTVKTSVLAIFW